MSCILPGHQLEFDFVINTSAGSIVNPDSPPTGTLIRNGEDSIVSVSLVNKATGVYTASCTIPETYRTGDNLQIRIDAVVSGVTIKILPWGTIL